MSGLIDQFSVLAVSVKMSPDVLFCEVLLSFLEKVREKLILLSSFFLKNGMRKPPLFEYFTVTDRSLTMLLVFPRPNVFCSWTVSDLLYCAIAFIPFFNVMDALKSGRKSLDMDILVTLLFDSFQVTVFFPEKSWFNEIVLVNKERTGSFSSPRHETLQFGKGKSAFFHLNTEFVVVPVI